MTVYDFMMRFGRYEKFNIVMLGKRITNKKVCVFDIDRNEELHYLNDALERELFIYEPECDTLYC